MGMYAAGLRMESLYALVLKHAYWWECCVGWGEAQGRQLRHFTLAEEQVKEPAEEIVRTVDVVIAAFGGGGCCTDEEDDRKREDSNGLVTLGGRWFKIDEGGDSELVWAQEDYHM